MGLKRGRPTKRSALVTEMVCKQIAAGNTRRVAAVLSGISYGTLARWCQFSAPFREAVEKAEAIAEAKHVAAIVQAGVTGQWQASAWYLERRRHDDWRKPPEQVRHGGDPDNPTPLVIERVTFGSND